MGQGEQLIKGDKKYRPAQPALASVKPVMTAKEARSKAMQKGLNQYLLGQLETALRLLVEKEEIIRRMECGERRYRCHGCERVEWASWLSPPEGWQLFEDYRREEAFLCPSCARPRRARAGG